jgi:CheY-like chemotaxis protein
VRSHEGVPVCVYARQKNLLHHKAIGCSPCGTLLVRVAVILPAFSFYNLGAERVSKSRRRSAQVSDASHQECPLQQFFQGVGRMGGGCRVLVVDDEAGIRDTLARALSDAGFAADQAGSGAAALKLVANAAEPFALLVTDIKMPGMSGFELAEAVQRVSPTTFILFISGFPQEKQRHLATRSLGFLEKPFSAERFMKVVQPILNSHSHQANNGDNF